MICGYSVNVVTRGTDGGPQVVTMLYNVRITFRILRQVLEAARGREKIQDLPLLPTYQRRRIGTSASTLNKTSSESKTDPETEATSPPPFPIEDWIGPVDRKSNLHRVLCAQPKDETKAERAHRLLKEETLAWNQEFWSKQNDKFLKAKQRFTQDMFAFRGQSITKEDGTKRVLSAEELAEFYTNFLQQNRETFKSYNREWYKRNIYMLWPATHAAVTRLSKRFLSRS